MRSYSLINRYLQGRRELSDLREPCMYAQVCVCVCALPLDLDAFIVHIFRLPSSFKCVATEEGEWFVYRNFLQISCVIQRHVKLPFSA